MAYSRFMEFVRPLASAETLDTPAEHAFDELTALAAHACDAPIAMIVSSNRPAATEVTVLGREP